MPLQHAQIGRSWLGERLLFRFAAEARGERWSILRLELKAQNRTDRRDLEIREVLISWGSA